MVMEDKGFHIFLKGISLKLNVIGLLEFKLANFDAPKIWICHHHHVVPPAWISLTLSHLFSLSFIASGRSWGLHPVSPHSCCVYVWAGCPASARPYVGVHRSTSLMSLSLLLQQCPACLVCLTWIDFVKGGRWPCSWCFVGCCLQDLFNIEQYWTWICSSLK